MSRLFGSLVVQNEGDVIEDLLRFLAKLDVFEKIFFFDLGSTDGTFEKASRFEGLLHEPQVVDEVYTNPLRMTLLLKNRHLYRSGDWVAILDADEFYAEDVLDLLRFADREGADSVLTHQAEFYLTHEEVASAAAEDASRPIFERRRRYLVDWSELRFFRYLPERYEGPVGSLRPCSRKLLNRHYQYRTPEQIRLRLKTRLENRRRAESLPGREEWPQVFSDDWRDYLMPSRVLHEDRGGELRFGVPGGVRPEDYFTKNPFSRRMAELAEQMKRERGAPTATEPRGDRIRPLRLTRLGVHRTRAGEPFNVQATGESALWVLCENAEPGSVIVFGESPLSTVRGGPGVLTAIVPSRLYERPGVYPVFLARDRERSNVLEFVVESR